MIKRIWLRNYGPFKEAELSLGPLTVIVGPNASGKSIALEALHRVRTEDYRKTLFSMRRKGSASEAVEIGFDSDSHEAARYILAPDQDPSTPVRRVDVWDKTAQETTLVRLLPQALRKASYIDSDEPRMRENGYGLATALAYMKLSESERYSAVEKQTRAIVPTFEGLRFRRAKVEAEGTQPIYGDELVFDMKGARGLSPMAVSDGTLLTLGLLALTIDYSRRYSPLVFLIDELERSLHPKALGELIGQLRRLTEESEVQILATSHSPYLVDWLKPEEVRITGLLENGTATIRELGDHPDFDRWKEEMSPGEFWSTVGEDWIK